MIAKKGLGIQVGEGINEFLIMKQKKDMPMPPPGTPHPEPEDPAGGNLDIDQLRPSLSMPTVPHSIQSPMLHLLRNTGRRESRIPANLTRQRRSTKF
jgi:hypothetical protein